MATLVGRARGCPAVNPSRHSQAPMAGLQCYRRRGCRWRDLSAHRLAPGASEMPQCPSGNWQSRRVVTFAATAAVRVITFDGADALPADSCPLPGTAPDWWQQARLCQRWTRRASSIDTVHLPLIGQGRRWRARPGAPDVSVSTNPTGVAPAMTGATVFASATRRGGAKQHDSAPTGVDPNVQAFFDAPITTS